MAVSVLHALPDSATMTNPNIPEPVVASGHEFSLLTRRLLRQIVPVSDMTIWRWEHDHDLGFPKAITINGRKYFDLDLIEEWERNRAAHSARRAA